MVKLEEVPDEDLKAEQIGPSPGGEDDWDDASSATSDGSSNLSLLAPDDETLWERIAALHDMVPASQRRLAAKSYSNVSRWVGAAARVGARCLWVVSSSALLLGVPWAIAYAEDQQLMQAEREAKMQQSANELLAPGSTTQQSVEARPAL